MYGIDLHHVYLFLSELCYLQVHIMTADILSKRFQMRFKAVLLLWFILIVIVRPLSVSI